MARIGRKAVRQGKTIGKDVHVRRPIIGKTR